MTEHENSLDELARILTDSLDNLHATAFTTGNGTSAPQGIVTGLMGAASEINTQGTEAIAATDPLDLQIAHIPFDSRRSLTVCPRWVIPDLAQTSTTTPVHPH